MVEHLDGTEYHVADCKACDGVGIRIVPRGGHQVVCERCQGWGKRINGELPGQAVEVLREEELEEAQALPFMGSTAHEWLKRQLTKEQQQRLVNAEVIDISSSCAENLKRFGCGVGFLEGTDDYDDFVGGYQEV